MSDPVGNTDGMHVRSRAHDDDEAVDELLGEAVRRVYAHAADIDQLTTRRHIRAAVGAVRRGESDDWWRTNQLARRRRRIGALTTKAAAVTVAGMVASTGLAAADVLPAPAARAIVRIVAAVGLPVPEPIETAADDEVRTTGSTTPTHNGVAATRCPQHRRRRRAAPRWRRRR